MTQSFIQKTTFFWVAVTTAVTIGQVHAATCFADRETLDIAIINMSGSGDSYTYSNYGSIENWCFAPALTNFKSLFSDMSSFNADISKWDVSNVSDMWDMFFGASSFNQDLSQWNVSKVTNMHGMFEKASSFNQDLNQWDVARVTDMQDMFEDATSFNGDISGWDVSQVTTMLNMFEGASSFNGIISGWVVSKVTDTQDMFKGASSFNHDINEWDVSQVTDMEEMFEDASSFNGDISGWNVSQVTDMKDMFEGASAFNGDISRWDVSNVKTMYDMFEDASSFNRDLSGWDVSKVTSLYQMFNGASLFNRDISEWDVSQVTDMNQMFNGASSFDQDLCAWGPKIFNDGTPPAFGDLFADTSCLNRGDPEDGIDGSPPQNFCSNQCTLPITNSGGDPHFIGFNQKVVTYQGECTLILMFSPVATSTGEDVTVHVRTTRKLDFSYISGVAMKIGENIIEVRHNADIILNGKAIFSKDVTMSSLGFVLTKEEKGTKKMIISYSFDIGNDRVITIQANVKRSMMFVQTKGRFPNETIGMLGSPGSHEMVTRDGRLMSEVDVNTFGESWQVKDTDDQLFKESHGPQYPDKCLYEDAMETTTSKKLRGRRKLMVRKQVSLEDAKAACGSVKGIKRELCIQDAISMGDLGIKDDPFYLDVE